MRNGRAIQISILHYCSSKQNGCHWTSNEFKYLRMFEGMVRTSKGAVFVLVGRLCTKPIEVPRLLTAGSCNDASTNHYWQIRGTESLWFPCDRISLLDPLAARKFLSSFHVVLQLLNTAHEILAPTGVIFIVFLCLDQRHVTFTFLRELFATLAKDISMFSRALLQVLSCFKFYL